jgi:tyrosinase
MPKPQDPGKPGPAAPRVAEMVGATSEAFYLGPEPTEITLEIHKPTGPAALLEGQTEKNVQREVYLYIENFWCTEPAPPFRVYLNVPPGDIPEKHPELQVGNLGTFGLMKQSNPQGPHGGNGMSFTVDITDAIPGLMAAKNWDSRRLRVSFTPGFWEGKVPAVKVGRVSLYFK